MRRSLLVLWTVFVWLLLPGSARAGVYAYSEMGVWTDGSYIYLSATGIAISDDPDPGVGVAATLYDPSNNVIADNWDWSTGWDVVVYGDAVALSEGSAEGTYNAKAVGWTGGSGYACSPFTPVQISHYRHHYDFAAMGNPNTYSLAEDSWNRACSHIELTWDPTSLSGLTDSGLYAHAGSTPLACLAVCSAGKTGNAAGPGGSTLGPAACG